MNYFPTNLFVAFEYFKIFNFHHVLVSHVAILINFEFFLFLVKTNSNVNLKIDGHCQVRRIIKMRM
jgi:hypothetical protein